MTLLLVSVDVKHPVSINFDVILSLLLSLLSFPCSFHCCHFLVVVVVALLLLLLMICLWGVPWGCDDEAKGQREKERIKGERIKVSLLLISVESLFPDERNAEENKIWKKLMMRPHGLIS